MSTLSDKRCVPCEGGIPALSPEVARAQLTALSAEWRLAGDSRSVSREFKFVDFYRTMSFVNALAHIANIEDHHPDLEVGYNYCRVRYSTHSVNGLSDNDFICAAKIDQLPLN
jgi:4a-hydroxytetrahydrobiopterin dehydratase